MDPRAKFYEAITKPLPIALPPARKARSCGEHSRSNSAHAPSQPLVGCTPRSRRTAQVGDCGGAIHGAQIYLPRPRKPPSQTWRTFLTNHLVQTATIDFFTVPTATFRVLFVLVVLSHERRRVCRHNDAHIIDVFDEIVFALFKPHNLFSNAMMQAAVDGHTAQQPRVWLLPFSPSGLTCFGLLFNCAISTKRHF